MAAALPLTVMALGLDRGRRSAHALMLEYLADESPHLLARSETRAFARWLGTRLEPGVIVEVLRIEAAAFDAIIDGDVAEVRLRIDPPAVRASLSAGRLPELEPHDRYLVSVTG